MRRPGPYFAPWEDLRSVIKGIAGDVMNEGWSTEICASIELVVMKDR